MSGRQPARSASTAAAGRHAGIVVVSLSEIIVASRTRLAAHLRVALPHTASRAGTSERDARQLYVHEPQPATHRRPLTFARDDRHLLATARSAAAAARRERRGCSRDTRCRAPQRAARRRRPTAAPRRRRPGVAHWRWSTRLEGSLEEGARCLADDRHVVQLAEERGLGCEMRQCAQGERPSLAPPGCGLRVVRNENVPARRGPACRCRARARGARRPRAPPPPRRPRKRVARRPPRRAPILPSRRAAAGVPSAAAARSSTTAARRDPRS